MKSNISIERRSTENNQAEKDETVNGSCESLQLQSTL